jgi:hypothetical protein
VQFLGDEAGQRAAVGLVGPLLLEGEQVLLQHLEKGGLFRLPAGIGVAGRRFCACRCLHEGGCRLVGHGSCLVHQRSPEWIGLGHLADERLGLRGDLILRRRERT